jgi:gliding motility-associated peptidyl-prolyl isomerase
MKNSKSIAIVFFLLVLVASCKQQQEARKPISQASGSFMKKSIQRNKKMIAGEEEQINAVIKKNPKAKFIASSKGYWYSYAIKNELDTLTPKKGDVAFFDYEVKDLKGNIIYSELELRPQTYYIDKQDIMMGLRDGIKLMRKKEKVNFLFTSHMGYGYHGDNKKIGTNQPLLCTVTLRDFMSEAAYKKKIELQKAASVKPAVATKTTPKDTITSSK